MHNSHPVHNSGITLCINLAAPMMASASAYSPDDVQQIEAGTSEVSMTASGVIEVLR